MGDGIHLFYGITEASSGIRCWRVLHFKIIWFDTCSLQNPWIFARAFPSRGRHSLVELLLQGKLTIRTCFLTRVPQILLVTPITAEVFYRVLQTFQSSRSVPCKFRQVPSTLLRCHSFQLVAALVTILWMDPVTPFPQCIIPRTKWSGPGEQGPSSSCSNAIMSTSQASVHEIKISLNILAGRDLHNTESLEGWERETGPQWASSMRHCPNFPEQVQRMRAPGSPHPQTGSCRAHRGKVYEDHYCSPNTFTGFSVESVISLPLQK